MCFQGERCTADFKCSFNALCLFVWFYLFEHNGFLSVNLYMHFILLGFTDSKYLCLVFLLEL